MTPEKRLNQIEPEIADLHLKTDRLIDTTGKILNDVVRIENKVDYLVGQLDSKVGQLDSKVGQVDSKVGQLDSKVDIIVTGLAKLTVDVDGLCQEMQEGFIGVHQEMNQRFERVENTQQEILTFLRERLG